MSKQEEPTDRRRNQGVLARIERLVPDSSQPPRSLPFAAVFSAGIATPVISLGGWLAGAISAAIPAYLYDRQYYGDGNDDAGTIFFAGTLLVGCLGFMVVSVFVARWFGRRLRGGRLSTWLLAMWVPAAFIVAAVVPGFAERGGFDNAGRIVGLVGAVGLFVGYLLATLERPRSALTAVGIVIAAVIAGLAIGPLRADAHDIASFEAAGTPLALVDADALGEVLPNWTVGRYHRPFPMRYTHGEVPIVTSTGYVLALSFVNRPRLCRSERNTCVDLGLLDDGSPVVGFLDPGCRDDLTRIEGIVVSRPTGHWKIAAARGKCADPTGFPRLEELEQLVAEVESVDAATWLAQEKEDRDE